MSTRINKTLIAARMLIDAGDIDEPIDGDFKRAEYGDANAMQRIEEAMARFRYAEGDDGAEVSTSGSSAANLIANPALSDEARQAAIHGGVNKFLRRHGIIGRPDNISEGALAFAENLGKKQSLAGNVLKGIAKAAHAAGKDEEESVQVGNILVSIYNDLLAKFIETDFHPALARAVLDEFFSENAFAILQRLRSFDTAKWRKLKDTEKIGALAVFIVDKIYSDNATKISAMREELATRLSTNPEFRDLPDSDIHDLTHYASVGMNVALGMRVIRAILENRARVEEEFDATVYDSVKVDIARAAQFSSDPEDAIRRGDLILNQAREVFRHTFQDLDNAQATRLAVLCLCHATRTGINQVSTFVVRTAESFLAISRHPKGKKLDEPAMELAFKSALIPDPEVAVRTFVNGRRILERIESEISKENLEPKEVVDVLLAVVEGLPVEHFDNMKLAVDISGAIAQKEVRRILREPDTRTLMTPPPRRSSTPPTRGAAPGIKPPRPKPPPPIAGPGTAAEPEQRARIKPRRPDPRQRTSAPAPTPRSDAPRLDALTLIHRLQEKYNFCGAFIRELAFRLSNADDQMRRRAIVTALMNISMSYLKSEHGVRSSVALAMLQERMLSNADHYFERIAALPIKDQEALESTIDELSNELTADVAKNSLEGHDVKVREVAIRLSKWIDAEDAVHMAATLAPFLVDDSDCERVIDNYKAVLAYLMGTIHKDAAKQIARGVRLEGDKESAVESAKRYTRQLASVRSQPQFKGINPGRIADIFNIALGIRIQYEMATHRAADIAGTYMDALKTLGLSGIWHGADDLALLVSSYDDPSESLGFVMEAYGEVVDYLESKNLGKDVEGRLAAVICKRVLDMNRSRSGGPTRIMRVYAAQYFDIYNNIYSAFILGGLEEGLAIDRALALTSVYDESRTPFMVRQEIARRNKPDGDDEGPGSGSAPVAGSDPQGTPTPPVGNGTEAKGSLAGIVREGTKAAPCDEACDGSWMADNNSMIFPGAANHMTMILGARVALTASAL